DVRFYFKFAAHTVDDDIEVKFSHPGDKGLVGFFIGADAKGRVFFSEFVESDPHFFLIGLGFWFNGDLDDWLWEDDLFEEHWGLFIAERVSRKGIFQSYHRSDISCRNFFDFLSLIGMHLQETSDTL